MLCFQIQVFCQPGLEHNIALEKEGERLIKQVLWKEDSDGVINGTCEQAWFYQVLGITPRLGVKINVMIQNKIQ